MTVALPVAQRRWTATGLTVAAVWLGMLLGVSFLATPAKFMASSLTLPVALDVGRHTFAVFNKAEWLLSALLLGALLFGGRTRLGTAAVAAAILLVAMETFWLLPLLDQPFKQPLLILATCDEESSMSGARALAEAGRPLGRAAVIGEPTGLRPVRLHKGIMMEGIEIHGQSGHSSNPAYGHSALEAMHEVMGELMALRREWQSTYNNPLFDVPQPTLNLGCIHGGDNPNRICGQCSLEYDLRPLPGMEPEQLRDAIAGRLRPVADRHQVKIDLAPLFPSVPAFDQPADAELVRLAERLTGHAAEAVAFATEAPYLQQLGCETLVLGPGDIACAHQPDEYLELDRIEPTVRLLRGMIEHYCLQPGRG